MADQLSKKLAEAFSNAVTDGETVLSMMQNEGGTEAVIATDRRVLILKTGIAATGNIFGGSKVNSWQYHNIQSVEVGTSMMACRIEIKHAGVVSQAGSYGNQIQADHIVMFGKHRIEEVRNIAELIEEQMTKTTESVVKSNQEIDPLDRLKKLAELKDAGALTEAEYGRAKEAILRQIGA